MTDRFIDLAAHGGCSKKASALDLRGLFDSLRKRGLGTAITDISKGFPDIGFYTLNSYQTVSTIDIVLPMVLDAKNFGEITVAHVLSDIYAGLSKPIFALAVLGVPKGKSATSPEIIEMMSAAISKLNAVGVALVGGHTMSEQEDLFLGFAAVGSPIADNEANFQRSPKDGDCLILTKPVGTSIASLRWKLEEKASNDHYDVLQSMLRLNDDAAKCAVRFAAKGCTDITGFGLLGHLHNLLLPNDCSADISIENVPIFESLKSLAVDEIDIQSRQYWHNMEYIEKHVSGIENLTTLQKNCLIDSQVSGGLLFSIPKSNKTKALTELHASGHTAACIGYVNRNNPSGHITVI